MRLHRLNAQRQYRQRLEEEREAKAHGERGGLPWGTSAKVLRRYLRSLDAATRCGSRSRLPTRTSTRARGGGRPAGRRVVRGSARSGDSGPDGSDPEPARGWQELTAGRPA